MVFQFSAFSVCFHAFLSGGHGPKSPISDWLKVAYSALSAHAHSTTLVHLVPKLMNRIDASLQNC